MSAPLPAGTEVSLVGRSTATFAHPRTGPVAVFAPTAVESEVPSQSRPVASTIPNRMGTAQIRTTSRTFVLMMFSKILSRSHGHRLDHVAHEARAVPVGMIGLGNACCVERLDHQRVRTWR